MARIYFDVTIDIPNRKFWVERSYQEEPPIWHVNGEAVPHSYANGRFFPTGTPGVFQFFFDNESLDFARLEQTIQSLIETEMIIMNNFKLTCSSDLARQLNLRKEDHHA